MKHILDLPWGPVGEELREKHGLKTIKGGYAIYGGVLLPKELRPYQAEDFTLPRWLEDEQNAHVSTPERGLLKVKPSARASLWAGNLKGSYGAGKPGHLLISPSLRDRGVAALAGLTSVIEEAGGKSWDDDFSKDKLLIVTTKSMVSFWQELLREFPALTAVTRPLVVTYPQVSKLLITPATARIAQKKSLKERATSTAGTPAVPWDFLLLDEVSEVATAPLTLQSKAVQTLGRLAKPYQQGVTPFTVYTLSEPLSNPLAYALLAPLLPLSSTLPPTPGAWPKVLQEEGFKVSKVGDRYLWAGETKGKLEGSEKYLAAVQARNTDLRAFRSRLRRRGLPVTLEEEPPAGLSLVPYPLPLTGKNKVFYGDAWKDLRLWLNKNSFALDQEALAAKIDAYERQTAFLREGSLVTLVEDLTALGRPVYLRASTPQEGEKLKGKLEEKKVKVALDPTGREQGLHQRLRRGEVEVLLTSAPQALPLKDLPRGVTALCTSFAALPLLREELLPLGERRAVAVLVPYLPRTFEERLLPAWGSLETGAFHPDPPADTLYERELRGAAARTTPPNRLS